jgi:hypothetical protein
VFLTSFKLIFFKSSIRFQTMQSLKLLIVMLMLFVTVTYGDNTLYCFYDIETVYTDNGVLMVYSISYIFLTFEEILLFNYKKYKNKYNSNIKTQQSKNEKDLKSNVLIKSFVDDIDKKLLNKTNVRLVGFNNSAFDNFFVVKEMKNRGMVDIFYKDSEDTMRKKDCVFVVKNKIYNFNYSINNSGKYKCSSSDILLITGPLSLKSLTNDMKTEPIKGDWDHNRTQELFEKDFNSFIKSINTKECIEYNNNDVFSLIDLSRILQKEYKTIFNDDNFNIFNYMTQAQLCGSFLNENYLKKYKCFAPEQKKIWEEIKSADSGGMCRTFSNEEKLKFDKCFLFDVNSLYPFVCLMFDFPCGKMYKTLKEVKNKLGVYLCSINQTNTKYTFIPEKNKKGNNYYSRIFERRITTYEIEYLRELGCDVLVKEGYYWEDRKPVFKEYMLKFQQLKEEEDLNRIKDKNNFNSSKRFIYKQFLNIATGFVMKGLYRDKYNYKKESTVQLGVFIHALSRIYIHKIGCNNSAIHPIYCDTDSLLIPENELTLFLQTQININGNIFKVVDEDKTGKFGLIQEKYVSNETIVLGKKKYLLNNTTLPLFIFAGINNKTEWKVINQIDSSLLLEGKGKNNVEMMNLLQNEYNYLEATTPTLVKNTKNVSIIHKMQTKRYCKSEIKEKVLYNKISLKALKAGEIKGLGKASINKLLDLNNNINSYNELFNINISKNLRIRQKCLMGIRNFFYFNNEDKVVKLMKTPKPSQININNLSPTKRLVELLNNIAESSEFNLPLDTYNCSDEKKPTTKVKLNKENLVKYKIKGIGVERINKICKTLMYYGNEIETINDLCMYKIGIGKVLSERLSKVFEI